MPRLRSRSFQRNRVPSNKSWAVVADLGNTLTAANSKQFLGSLVLSNPGIDETILRTVGIISVASDQNIADETQVGVFGMIKVSDRAAVIGATAIPGPITDGADDGWIAWVPFEELFILKTAVGFDANITHRYAFDFKTKRVNHDGEQVAMIWETGSTSDGVTLTVLMRVLSMVRGT